MRWLLKAAAQGTASLLPQSEKINYVFQKYLTRRMSNKSSSMSKRLGACAQHIEYWYSYSQTDQMPDIIFELGTGWIPTVPIGMFLCGAPSIYTIDIRRLIRLDVFASTFAYIATAPMEDFARQLPRLQPERFEQLQAVARQAPSLSVDEVMERLNIHSIIGDARSTTFDPASMDFIISNTTLEHISEPILNGLFKEFRRIIEPKGLMSHRIDLSDHYSHFDHSITPYNFLKYDSQTWRFFNNDIQYQNRLRASDYRAIHTNNGFQIVAENLEAPRKADLPKVKVAPEFQHYTVDELAPTSMRAISKTAEHAASA